MATKNDFEIIILTHGLFGEELINSQTMITGETNGLKSFSLLPEMSIEELYKNVDKYIKTIDTPLIVLTDLIGGTPNNVAVQLSNKHDMTIISGVNLPILIELVLSKENRNITLKELIENAINSATNSISVQEMNDVNIDDLF